MKTILVTGGAGFIGSHFIKMMLKKYPSYKIINLDALTYAGNLENLSDIKPSSHYRFIKGDIRDKALLDNLFYSEAIDGLVNFAAESHVDRSIQSPDVFLRTNIIGTQVLLETAMKHWTVDDKNEEATTFKAGVKFLQISTDEVYGTLGDTGFFTENSPIKPNSPYAASKASGDLMVMAYHQTYGLPVNITRSSNNYGPHQFPEKLIPLMINNAIQDKDLPIYGDGLQIRDWLHVDDHCLGLDAVLHKGIDGEVYNIGGKQEIRNIDLVKEILKILKKPENLIKHVKDRLGHDRRYAIDNGKIKKELAWQPTYNFEEGLKETIEWYLKHDQWMKNIRSGDYKAYPTSMLS